MTRRKKYDAVESQARFHTPAFGIDFMRKTIGIGTPLIGPKNELMGFDTRANTTISLGAWLNFVPKEYREDCISYARLALEKYRGEPMGGNTLQTVVAYLHQSVWECLLPLPKEVL